MAETVGMTVAEKHGFFGLSRWPNKQKIKAETAAADYFLAGFVPPSPVISKTDRITAFGSCFAGNVSRYLAANGYQVNAHKWRHADSDLIRIDEIMVHTAALRVQFEWAFENKELGSVVIGGKEEKIKSYHSLPDIRSLIVESDVYVVTYGLTEAWYDNVEGRYLWKFVPHKHLDTKRYVNKSLTFAENSENIQRIYDIIRSHRPDAKIIFTLSPIPLLGTYLGKAIVCANAFSKSKLRAAIGEFMEAHHDDQKLFYFPSYELVMQYLTDPWEDDNRHMTPEATSKIMDIFAKYFLSER